MVDINAINQGLISKFSFSKGGILNAVGWLVLGLFVIGGAVYGFWWWNEKKKFNKKITAFEIIGSNFSPVYRDVAKTVKIGKGGFELLYLKKLKTWKLAYGGRIGKDTYYFFIGKDGYWYNGMLSSDISTIDKNNGLIPIVTTNPNMRGQYTSLEKQIDTLHGEKVNFWDKYGSWVLSIGFVLIIGVLAWLIFKEISPLMGQFTTLTDRLTELTNQMNRLIVNINGGQGTGLVPATAS